MEIRIEESWGNCEKEIPEVEIGRKFNEFVENIQKLIRESRSNKEIIRQEMENMKEKKEEIMKRVEIQEEKKSQEFENDLNEKGKLSEEVNKRRNSGKLT